MERKVDRERKLSAFEIDLGDLEALLQRLCQLFDSQAVVRCKIEISLKQESLTFKSVDEIKEYGALKGSVAKFFIRIFDMNCRSISVSSGCRIFYQATVSANAESEAWCAGAIETVTSFLQTKRVWYHWFAAWPYTVLILIMAGIPYAIGKIIEKDFFKNKSFAIGWLITMLLFAILSISRERFFPAGSLTITSDESFLRRKASELTLIIAIISALLTIIGWFVGK